MAVQIPKPIKRGALVLVLASLAGCAAQRHHSTGVDALERKDYVTAVHELQKAAELKPGDLIYRRDWMRAREDATDKLLAAAQAAMATGERKAAERSFLAILQIERDNARALAGLERLDLAARADIDASAAEAAFKSGDVMKAGELVARALKAAPAHPAALTMKGEIDALHAQELQLEPSLSSLYKKPINLEFRDASIRMVFDALSRSTGINFIFDREVKADQRTTVFLKQTPLDDAISVILSTSQLEKKVLNQSSVLIYPNTAGKQREYQDLVVRAFYLSNVEAKQAASLLKTVLKVKDAFVDDKYNMLVLREPPETIALAEKLIRLHDLEEPEVMLEVEVLEINRSRLLNAGIQWNSAFTVAPMGGTSSTPQGGASTAVMKLSDLRNLTSGKLGITAPSATVNLQKIDGDANLLANPRIRVRDREKAKVMIGDKVPVVTTTSTNNFVTENIQYLDVGLKLEVEPDIHLRDEIGLKISMEVSSLVSSIKTHNGSQAYQIGTRNFNSTLRLKDGETQILAGLINDEDRVSANRVPLLGDLPILGRLFGSQNDNRQKTEIVLSITPHLIRNMQRKDPSQESFWSGTESSLRNRPLQLREMNAVPGADQARPGKAAPAAAPSSSTRTINPVVVSPPGAPKAALTGPASAKVGEVIELALEFDSADSLRATSLQLSYQPADFEVVSVDDGQYFGKEGKGAFSKSVDAASGRISIGISAPEGAPRNGAGKLALLKLRALKESPETSVGVIALTPIGAEKAVPRPGLPLLHMLAVGK